MATATDFPYLATRTPIAMAHRGGAAHPANVGLENTMVAFRAAVALGYRYLETDVHATADGRVVAFHDPRLDRVTDAEGAIAALPYAAVREARIAGRESVPLLEELLEELPETRSSTSTSRPTGRWSRPSPRSAGSVSSTACASGRSRSVGSGRSGRRWGQVWRPPPGPSGSPACVSPRG